MAGAVGLRTLGFAKVTATPRADHFQQWLDAGFAADMEWMHRGTEVRLDPTARFASARTAIVFAVEHHHVRPPRPSGRVGRVARYAWGRDYHNLIGKRLKRLRRDLRAEGVESWGGVDTAPIMERVWAQAAGIGFTGKNSVQFIPGRTSWMFLAVLFVDVPVEPDPPLFKDHCGTCSRCLVGCPTDAFAGPRQLDSRLCISYWTIEASALPPEPLRTRFGDWVFGCDVCQEVCPHNTDPPPADEDDFGPRHAWLDLDELLQTPDEALMERFIGTPLRRPKAHGLKRNALIVLANLGDPGGAESAELALQHSHPMVREAAEWCLRRLAV